MIRMRSVAGRLIAPILVAFLTALAAAAAALEPVRGEVVLTVTGEINATNAGEAAVFDLEALAGMETVTFETSTIWTEGQQSFTGIELKSLLDLLGTSGTQLRASAVNDYAVEIPVTDAVEGGPILAFERNGKKMSLRDKGPLWIVYPYDSAPAYQSELIYSRSIWQLDRIEVLP